MRNKKRLLPVLLVFLLSAPILSASDWPHLRGPDSDGRVAAPGTFEVDDVGLDLAWRVPLGSAYSGIAIAEGRAVTLYGDDEGDWVAAFDAKSGKRLWRHRLGDPTKGKDGSDDGPLSSPAVGAGLVFAIGSTGRLVALRAADGEVAWQKQLETDFGSTAPHFGFTTTPLVVGKTVVVQVGGSEGRSIVGLDANSGARVWAHGEGKVDYQSPALMELAGRRQIVAVDASAISGLSESGELLWERAMGEEERASSVTPTFIGEDRFVVPISGDVVAFRVTRSEPGFAVEELYRSEALGRNYAPPVYHEGHLYGFRGQVLTCIDASSGERVWRSRPPGGDGLILVDGHLVIFGAKGNVVVAVASPEGYQERARLQALGGSGLTWPSFADGRIYIRNLHEMAAVGVTRGRGAAPVAGVLEPDHEFGRFIRRLNAADNRSQLLQQFLDAHETFPIVEGEFVHFTYHGEATDVAIAGTMNDTESAEPMQRVEGTDLFYRTYQLEPGGRWEYRFQVDFENWAADPRNPRSVPALEGEETLSELVTPGYEIPGHLKEPEGLRGKLDSFQLASEILGYEKKIQVWLPPGYDEGDRSYPVMLVNDGPAWLEKGMLTHTLDNLVGRDVEPLIVAFIEPYGQWWLEAGGTRTDDYVRMQVEELLPALQERYRLAQGPEARAVMGNRFYALSTTYAALKHPEVFGHAALQSIYLGLGAGDDVTAMIREGAGSSVHFYLDWNRYDERNVDRDYDFAEDSRMLAGMLQAGGYALDGGEALDSAGWSGWRNRADRVLTALFPKK